MNDKITMSNIENISPDLLQMITLENDNMKKWAIKNKFNQMTPLFENVPYIVPYDDKSLLLIGQINGIKKIYQVRDVNSKNECMYRCANTKGNLVYLNDIDENVSILTTDRGECLFDKATLKPKSDIFDSIAFLNNRLIFTKVMSHDGRDNHYYGDVNKDGVIGKYLYDEESDDFINTPIIRLNNKNYDVIDEFKLDEILSKRSANRTSVKKAKLKILSRLNMVRE